MSRIGTRARLAHTVRLGGFASALLGVVVLTLEHAPAPYADLSRLGGPWLVVAFLCGRLAGRPLAGAVAGAAGLTITNFVYYLAKALWGSPINPAAFDDRTFWFAIGVAVGVIFGAIGASSVVDRPAARFLPAGILAGTFASEAFWLLRDVSLGAGVVLVGVALALLTAKSTIERVAALATASATCVVALGVLDTLLVALRFNG